MQPPPAYLVGCYARLSREDGDKPESDSIINQQRIIEDYCAQKPELALVDTYVDDGYTGTNFHRPAFERMVEDIQRRRINCVIVKDLSRFGRDYIDMGYYLERYFPTHRVRFIAINDHVDSLNGPYDMMLPLKNVFNTQYARDISDKVRSAFQTKQKRGEFVGAFASYGYLKDPDDHNHLIVDPIAAEVVQRIFQMAADGVGQIRIAKTLNEEKIPCPSEYKRLMGMKYRNGNLLDTTHYWTYATIHRMLSNEMYLGNMVQRRSVRPTMHGKARSAEKENWIVVPQTHEPIVSQELWDTVQAQVNSHGKAVDFQGNVGLLAGFLKCGDCGRAMTKTTWSGRVTYTCGSYHRYGANICSSHHIRQEELERVLLDDLNAVIAAVGDLKQLTEECEQQKTLQSRKENEKKRMSAALQRVQRLKQSAYEDYREEMLSREEYLRYKADYDEQEGTLCRQLAKLEEQNAPEEILQETWAQQLLRMGKLTALDRATLAQTVKEIRIFEDKHMEITYLFSEELRVLFDNRRGTKEENP